jgi:choline/glycine/proline betaine transport protein
VLLQTNEEERIVLNSLAPAEHEPKMVASSGLFKGINPTMGRASLVLVLGFVVYTISDVERAGEVFGAVRDWIGGTLAWYYVAFVCVILFSTVWLSISRYGGIRLGADDERPEFSTFSWVAMMLGASIGIGLLFWSITEPIQHFQANPFADMAGIEARSPEAAQMAMRLVIFHWGIHGCAVYAFVGLTMAYFSYRKGLPLTIRSALYPLIGKRIYGPAGHAVDLLALFGTVFGIATSLGLGAAQMSTGIEYLFGFDASLLSQLLVVAVFSAVATMAAVSGVRRGIRIVSEWNIRISVVLLAFILVAGPTSFLLGLYIRSIGDYLWSAIPMGFWVDPDPEAQWQSAWTIFYWGWFISWGPFVGMFIARISRGRTIRSLLIGTLLVPTALAMLWHCLFGGTALFIELHGPGGIVEAVGNDLTSALYRTLELMDVAPWTWLAAATATLLIGTWFITSSDAATLVICTILAAGNPHPPNSYRIFWGAGVGAVAAALLVAGGLQALQTASIVAALPLSVVMLIMGCGFAKSLAREPIGTSD